VGDALAWGPDVAFSHNMRPLEVERRLLDAVPVAKFMHGYFGTCIGGQKAHLFPRAAPCGRRFGPACLALYVPRRNGRMSLPYIAGQWRWAGEQNALFGRYAAVVTASGHMRREYVRNGVGEDRAHALPLFPTLGADPGPAAAPGAFGLLFLGRMTRLKGGDVLVRAVARASEEVGRAIPVTLAGDGPQRAEWEALARELGVDATFTGWVDSSARPELFRAASLLVVPSVWPEPFGLVGLEAGLVGVPALAFDVGGIGEWLRDGHNGRLVRGDPPTAEALAAGIARAFKSPEELREMRIAARETAERLSLPAHLDRLERVLSSISLSAVKTEGVA
jgi:glycosyltransferase involved in cell wall biosynthesis